MTELHRLISGRTGARLPLLACLWILCAGLSTGACGATIPQPATGSAPARTAGGAGLPVPFRVVERSQVSQPDGLLETGVPLAPGVVDRSLHLRVLDGGRAIPAGFEALSYWPDGSVRWAKLTLPLAIPAGATKDLSLDAGLGPALASFSPKLPEITLTIDTEDGAIRVPIRSGPLERHGRLGIEADIEPLSPRSARLRIHIEQIDGNGTWRGVALHVASAGLPRTAREPGASGRGDWCGAAFRAAERGPMDGATEQNGFAIDLIPRSAGSIAADAGFHVTYEVVLERSTDPDGLAKRVAKPLRASFPPSYVDGTRAMGRTGVPDASSRSLDDAFRTGWDAIREQQKLPRNRGAQNWGDFFDRRHGLAYAGYLDEEYDPSAVFFLEYARTGDADALDLAADMAREYADACTGLDGGSYQHRATLDALEGVVSEWIARKLPEKWRKDPSRAAGDTEIGAYMSSKYGEKAASVTREHFAMMPKSDANDPAAREAEICRFLGSEFVHSARGDVALVPGAGEKIGENAPDMRAYAELLLATKTVAAFDPPDLDKLFAPFFQRYGGSWSDFPAFHSCDAPTDSYRHEGGHSLAEMLVWGYLWTGDPSLKRTALRVANYHVAGGLVDRGIAEVTNQARNKAGVTMREVGWPLIDLLALEVLTSDADDSKLHDAVEGSIHKIVQTILTIDPKAYDGPIHLGVVGEGLARYDERYDDPAARDYLTRLYRYWAKDLWDEGRGGFQSIHEHESDSAAEVTSLCLYGMAYAAATSHDPLLEKRAEEAYRVASASRQRYAKGLAQTLRGTLRASGLMSGSPKN